MLGFPEEHWQSVARWSDQINQVVSVTSAEEIDQIGAALGELRDFTVATVEELRQNPRENLGSMLIAAEEQGDRLTYDELLEMFESVLAAGAETVRTMLTFSFLLFSQHPEQWKALRADPSLVPSAVEEVLRYRPPFIGPGARLAREEVLIKQTIVPQGTFFTMGMSANFDADVYSDPDEFDVSRFAVTTSAGKLRPPHFTLGHGWHACIGAFLARVEMQEAFHAMAERMPNLRLNQDDEVGVQWNSPYGIHGPCRLPIRWD
jgi:cytochrome P450